MSPEEARIRANEAKQLLENPLLVSAFEAVAGYLEAKTLGCDPDNKDAAQRLILSKQILAAIKREIERVIENGVVAEIQIAQLERKTLKSIFRR